MRLPDPRWEVLQVQVLLLVMTCTSLSSLAAPPIVIAHRGASGYLPEHTLPAAAMAHAMGADFIEQDVVLTRDDQPIVLHDVHLDTVTDVAQRFPERARADGRFYALDFTLTEVRALRVHERIDVRTGQAVFPRRFPVEPALCQIPTLAEEIQLVQGLNRSRQRQVGIYPEIKAAAWHRQQGHDISRIVLQVLDKFGYRSAADPVFLQCFEADELRRIRHEMNCKLRLIQLLEDHGPQSEPPATPVGPTQLAEIATYASGIGPALTQILSRQATPPRFTITDLARDARQQGLLVHAYTVRTDDLPAAVRELHELLELLLTQAQIDGVFTDQPDLVRQFIDQGK